MESINNDYCPGAFATTVMPKTTSQWSLINTYKSHKKNIIITRQISADCSHSTNYKAIMWDNPFLKIILPT